MMWKTPMELIDEIRQSVRLAYPTSAVEDLLTALSSKTEQLENQKKHFQGMCLRVFQFLDEHYPDAPGEFDIIENGGELE